MVYYCTSFIQHSMKIVLLSPVLIFFFYKTLARNYVSNELDFVAS